VIKTATAQYCKLLVFYPGSPCRGDHAAPPGQAPWDCSCFLPGDDMGGGRKANGAVCANELPQGCFGLLLQAFKLGIIQEVRQRSAFDIGVILADPRRPVF